MSKNEYFSASFTGENSNETTDEILAQFIEVEECKYKSPDRSKFLNISNVAWDPSFETPARNIPDTKTSDAYSSKTKLMTSTPSTIFKTASNKSINLSSKSILKAKKLIIDDANNSAPVESKNVNQKPKIATTSALKLKHVQNKNDSINNQVSLFKTARNTEIKINKDSLAKAKNIVECEKENSKPNILNDAPTLFMTGRMKKIDVNKESIQKATKIINSISSDVPKTANIEISNIPKSTEKELNEMKVDDFSFSNLSQNFFKTAGGDDIFVSQEAFIAAKSQSQTTKNVKNTSLNKKQCQQAKSNEKSKPPAKKLKKSSRNDDSIWIEFKPEQYDSRNKIKLYGYSVENTAADLLSQLSASKFFKTSPNYRKQIPEVPDHLNISVEGLKNLNNTYFKNQKFKLSYPFSKLPSYSDEGISFQPILLFQIFIDYLEYLKRDYDEKFILKWFSNHFFFIAWRNLAFEIEYSDTYSGLLFEPNLLLNQLIQRYSLENAQCYSSCLKKVYEQDEMPSGKTILFVSRLMKQPLIRLFLSDGWYEIECELDADIVYLINKGFIQLGMKVMIINSSISQLKTQAPHHPLEENMEQLTKLKINFNSFFPCWFDAPLGLSKNPGLPISQFDEIKYHGGTVCLIKFVLDRVYPIQGADDDFLKGNEEIEDLFHESFKAAIESKSNKVRKNFHGKDIFDAVNKSNVPNDTYDNLSESQKESYYKYVDELKSDVRQTLYENLNKRNYNYKKNYLPILVKDISKIGTKENILPKKAILIFHEPKEFTLDQLIEGKCFHLTFTRPIRMKSNFHSQISLSITKQSQLIESNMPYQQISHLFKERRLLTLKQVFDQISFLKEFDCVSNVVGCFETQRSKVALMSSGNSTFILAVVPKTLLMKHPAININKKAINGVKIRNLKCEFSMPNLIVGEVYDFTCTSSRIDKNLSAILESERKLILQNKEKLKFQLKNAISKALAKPKPNLSGAFYLLEEVIGFLASNPKVVDELFNF